MPRGDRTGPQGLGPMTGRGAGLCGGGANAGYMSAREGFAGCFGRRVAGSGGRGRGFRRMFTITGLPGWMRFGKFFRNEKAAEEDEIGYLKSQAEYFGKAMEEVNARLSKIETKD